MDLSSQKSNSIIRLSFFVVLLLRGFQASKLSLATGWGLGTVGAIAGLYLLMVYAGWRRSRTTAAWAIPLALSAVGLAVGWMIISATPQA